MSTRIPVIPTAFVAAAVVTMIALGFWQLGRMNEKEALIAQYRAVGEASPLVDFPDGDNATDMLFQRSTVDCVQVLEIQPTAGRNESGQSGWAQRALCQVENREKPILVDIGWTRSPAAVEWGGGEVTGIVAPGPRLVVSVAPTEAMKTLARPDPADVPNNHLAYAGQWFFFALTALIIYIIALRRRTRD